LKYCHFLAIGIRYLSTALPTGLKEYAGGGAVRKRRKKRKEEEKERTKLSLLV